MNVSDIFMRIAIVVSILLTLSGCGGVYYLDPEPRNNRCSDSTCSQLESYTSELYIAARSDQITYTQLVNKYYAKRDQLMPDKDDTDASNEIRSYQRVLAEQMDSKQITETQWVYLLDKKVGELKARIAVSKNNTQPQYITPYTAPARMPQCTTTNIGTRTSPNFYTSCY